MTHVFHFGLSLFLFLSCQLQCIKHLIWLTL
jgi:hypothetical protein